MLNVTLRIVLLRSLRINIKQIIAKERLRFLQSKQSGLDV